MIRVGISSCILGQGVRYDGGHKLDRYIRDTLGARVEFVPVCPEFEAGFGVPREPVRLAGDPAAPRFLTVDTDMDLTDAMLEWSGRRVEELGREGLRGFIFKARSPSCALSGLPIHDAAGEPVAHGAGLFASALMVRLPDLAVADEEMLKDELLRDRFLSRCGLR